MSSLIPIVIMLAAVAMVLGPILLLQPSQRQRRLINLRGEAAKQGLRVQFLPLPVDARRKRPAQMPAYTLPWSKDGADIKSWLLVRGSYEHELNFSGLWHWAPKLKAEASWFPLLESLLSALPEGIEGVGNGPQGLSLYWNERGDSNDVKALKALLLQLQGS